MAYVFGYNLTPYSNRIIKHLFNYRGMTAKQLVAMMQAPFSHSLSEEKSVYNYLRKLKKQGLVANYRLQANVSSGSLYYLTPKGFEYAKDMLNVIEGRRGQGWISRYEEVDLGDLPYDLYVPPLKQPAHHLMLIEFFLKLSMLDQVDDYEEIRYRNNLYSSQTYRVNGNKFRYRPDGEIIVKDKVFAIEVDRATESHEQLLQKFETYRQFLDYAAGDPANKIDGILFIVENKRREHGIRRRWTNILSAFLKKMDEYREDINLIMTSLDAVEDTLLFELERDSLEKKARAEIEGVLNKMGFPEVLKWRDTDTDQSVFSHGINDQYYRVFFNAISQEYESMLYTRYLDFLENRLHSAKKAEEVEGLKYQGHANVVFYKNHRKPFIANNLSHYNVDPQAVEKLTGLQNNLYTHSFNEIFNFSLFE